MSHEIRTPMNAIMGMSAVLDRLGLPPEHQRFVSDIRKASESLLGIINGILDFSKIEAGKMDIVDMGFNMTNLLDNLNSMFVVMGKQKKLDVAFDICPTFPTHARGDENRLRQILTNLLSNAVKYTNEGGLSLAAWLDADNNLRFDIKDTGLGIHKDDIGRLFTPFEQLDARKNRGVVGTGLGLAISHSLCRLMGGRIWVESTYGEGSVFSVELPYTSANEADMAVVFGAANFKAPEARILVVDDMETNLAVAEAMLEIFDIFPDLAESGPEAILHAKRKDYDLIFMDHMMPDMDGLETTLRIRQLGAHNAVVPIVALTANAIKGAEEMYLNSSMDDILPKPIELGVLNLCLRKWLSPKIVLEEE